MTYKQLTTYFIDNFYKPVIKPMIDEVNKEYKERTEKNKSIDKALIIAKLKSLFKDELKTLPISEFSGLLYDLPQELKEKFLVNIKEFLKEKFDELLLPEPTSPEKKELHLMLVNLLLSVVKGTILDKVIKEHTKNDIFKPSSKLYNPFDLDKSKFPYTSKDENNPGIKEITRDIYDTYYAMVDVVLHPDFLKRVADAINNGATVKQAFRKAEISVLGKKFASFTSTNIKIFFSILVYVAKKGDLKGAQNIIKKTYDYTKSMLAGNYTDMVINNVKTSNMTKQQLKKELESLLEDKLLKPLKKLMGLITKWDREFRVNPKFEPKFDKSFIEGVIAW